MKAGNLLWLFILLILGLMLLMPHSFGGIVFWFILATGIYLLYWILAGSPDSNGGDKEATLVKTDSVEQEKFDRLANQFLEVSGHKYMADTFSFEGHLRTRTDAVLEHLAAAPELSNREYFLQDIGEEEARLVILPKESVRCKGAGAAQPRISLHYLLLVATLVTTIWAGAAHQGIDLLKNPGQFMAGVPYGLGLMLILGAHEMGHYLTAKHYGIDVTPPYFIPVPFALGTFGAFISMRSVPVNRRALFDVAIAGPLAGLAVAIPALLIGLPLSTLAPGDPVSGLIGGGLMGGGTSIGSSTLLALLAKLSMGNELSSTHTLVLHPLAFAGWLGLLLTALNLLPIGQLDGGHVAQALFGSQRAGVVSSLALWGLFLLALFVWPGMLFFALLVLLVAGRPGLPPRNDMTKLSPSRKFLGYAAFALLALILLPLPHSLYTTIGIHCPYV